MGKIEVKKGRMKGEKNERKRHTNSERKSKKARERWRRLEGCLWCFVFYSRLFISLRNSLGGSNLLFG